MVDFDKLRKKTTKAKIVEPTEIFRRLTKPEGVNDLYQSQAEVLASWFDRRQNRDVVLKLHTGGGKTLVGLLIAQSTQEETGEPVLYLTPTVQLANQTIEKARLFGINAVPYVKREDLDEEFVNGKAIMVATYKALFNGRSKFKLRGAGHPQNVGAVVLDDAHVAFDVVRESFTLEVSSKKHPDRYSSLASLFRKSFKEMDRLGTFDDILNGIEYGVLEVPYWAWHEQLDSVREQLRADAVKFPFEWPLLRDELHMCHALISRDALTITPILPMVNAFPTFCEAPRRIYMSATIADDSDIVRTFDADPNLTSDPLTSRSLAGVSERMILIPDLMPFQFDTHAAVKEIAAKAAQSQRATVVLTPSDRAAALWSDVADVIQGSGKVESTVTSLQKKEILGPVVFANRYDGIDLPGDSCRLLVVSGLPSGTSNYELFRASSLYGGSTIIRMLAQRIEQGIGRGARGAGDHCVVLFAGADLAGWIAKDNHFRLLTSATRAQLEMGIDISREVKDMKELALTIGRSFNRDNAWTEYHAETLAEAVDGAGEETTFEFVSAERRAVNFWQDGHPGKAVSVLERALNEHTDVDQQSKGWMQQLAARIAHQWGQLDKAESLQFDAYTSNRNLLRPRIRPPYQPSTSICPQAEAIAEKFAEYHIRRGLLKAYEDVVSYLHANASANQFENALAGLGQMLGFVTERHDENGEGPDVLWLLPNETGWVIEAKSRKESKNPFKKGEHGQLLVAAEWFKSHYPNYQCRRVSIHPHDESTRAATAEGSFALTLEKLAGLVAEGRKLLNSLAECHFVEDEMAGECARQLEHSQLHSSRIEAAYLTRFKERMQ